MGKKTKNEIVWSDCSACRRSNKHSVLGYKSVETPVDTYADETKYYLVECNGCGSVSYREEYHDYEQGQYFGPEIDDYEHPITVNIYPGYSDIETRLDNMRELPDIVIGIYKETLSAIGAKLFILAGFGLRGLIEAICIDKGIKDIKKDDSLLDQIEKMYSEGLIAEVDKERLHGIRFLGNDSAHELKKVREGSALIALKIIDHILSSIYLVDKGVSKYLKVPFSKLEEVIPILDARLEEFDQNSVFSFRKWLGKDSDRLSPSGGKQSEIEKEFIKEVEEDKYQLVEFTKAPQGVRNPEDKWYRIKPDT